MRKGFCLHRVFFFLEGGEEREGEIWALCFGEKVSWVG